MIPKKMENDMKIILASSNKGKIQEIKEYFKDYEVVPYSELLGEFEIVEDADTFAGNASLKVVAIKKKLESLEGIIILADDSGITVPSLGGIPSVYSARYAGEGASDKDNLNKLISALKEKGIKRTPAFYTAAMAVLGKDGFFVVHGWMHGEVIDKSRGDKGFGYDPMFIPEGFSQTLGELDGDVKKDISHRTQALEHIKRIIS